MTASDVVIKSIKVDKFREATISFKIKADDFLPVESMLRDAWADGSLLELTIKPFQNEEIKADSGCDHLPSSTGDVGPADDLL